MVTTNSSNRSPSPMSMRPNPNTHNPNSRMNQEREGVGVRKSFTFAKSAIGAQTKSLLPNTPANSPAEYARRSSFGRERGIQFQDHEKENERDPNSKPIGKVGPPSISKGTKNFMSPTISAVSKINPSPRKKVLGERNEAIRTSASLSEGKFHFFSTSSLEFADENGSKEAIVTPPPCSTFSHFNKLNEVILNKESEKKGTDFSPVVEKIESEPDLVVLSPEIVNNGNSSETIPQSFMPELVSDNKNLGFNVKITTCSSPSTTIAPLDPDPSLPPYDPKTNFLSPRPQFLHYKPNPRIENYINQGIRFEDNFDSESVSESVISEEVQSEESSSSVEEKSSSLEQSFQLEDTDEPKIEAKSRFNGKWKAACFIFLFMLGFIAMYHENMISQIYGSLGLAREVKFSPLPFSNLTAWQEMGFENYLVKDFECARKEDDFELRPSSFGDIESEMKRLDDYETDELVTDQFIEEFEREKLEENYVLDDSVIEDEEFAVEMIEEASFFKEVENQEDEHDDNSIIADVEPQNDESQLDLVVEDHQSPEVEPQDDESQLDLKVEDHQAPEVEPQVTPANGLILEPTDEGNSQTQEASEGNLGSSIAVVVSLCVVSLLAALRFVKKPKKETSSIVNKEKSATYIPMASKISHENRPVEVDMIGESCPSEMSSFRSTSSYYNPKCSNEAQSVEKSSRRNYKRESLASSSSEYTTSSAYGSFTTYSILHSKQRDDEVVTPVRRSSRIRSKVTSP